jgi:hypothetical protein
MGVNYADTGRGIVQQQLFVLESVKFYNAATMQQMKQTIPLRCWLVAFGANNVKAIGKFGKVR